MADNSVLNAGAGGDTYASDDIGGVKFQRVKLIEGADGVNDGDISSANPLPTEQIGATPAGTNNIGDVDVLSMPTGASAAAVQGTVAHDSAAALDGHLGGRGLGVVREHGEEREHEDDQDSERHDDLELLHYPAPVDT